MPFRVGEQYTLGPEFHDDDVRAYGMTRETVLTVTEVGRDGQTARFDRIQGTWNNTNTRWFIPVVDYYIAWDENGIYVTNDGRHRLTLPEAHEIIQRDIGNANTAHIVPLRSIFQYTSDADGNITTFDHRNVQQQGA